VVLAQENKAIKPVADQADPSAVVTAPSNPERSPFLGVAIETLHPALIAQMPNTFLKGQGILIVQVAPGSPADKAGLKAHDVLMGYADQKLFSPEQLTKLVQSDKVGKEVKVTVVREGKSQDLTVKLGGANDERVGPVNPDSPSALRMPHWRWRMPEWFTHTPAPPANDDSAAATDSRWNNFDSLTVKRIGDNRFHVEIGFLNKEGKTEQRTFEGTREEIHKDIASQKDLPAIERDHLLRSLDISNKELPSEVPGALLHPRHHGQLPHVDETF